MTAPAETQPTTVPELAAILTQASATRRIVALAGPPGAGKSHTAAALGAALQAAGVRPAVLPMDGYHYDDAVLNARGIRARKGAPDTFDVAGLYHILRRLQDNDAPEVAVPVFDRDLEISRAGARIIPQSANLILVEGNYLLFNAEPWRALGGFFDSSVLITAPEAVLRQRLTQRWASAKLDAAEIARKVEDNDLPNCREVLAKSRAADYVIETQAPGETPKTKT